MIVFMLPHQVRTLDQVRGFLDGNEMGFRITERREGYQFITATLNRFSWRRRIAARFVRRAGSPAQLRSRLYRELRPGCVLPHGTATFPADPLWPWARSRN